VDSFQANLSLLQVKGTFTWDCGRDAQSYQPSPRCVATLQIRCIRNSLLFTAL